MIVQRKAALVGDAMLTPFDLGVVELLDTPALQAHEVIMVRTLVEFEYRLAGFEIIAFEKPGLLELGEHAINRGKAHLNALGQELPVDIFGAQVAHPTCLEQLQDAQARAGGLQTHAAQALRAARRSGGLGGCAGARHDLYFPVEGIGASRWSFAASGIRPPASGGQTTTRAGKGDKCFEVSYRVCYSCAIT